MAINKNKKLSAGVSLIELLIVIALMTTTLVSLLAIMNFSLRAAKEKERASLAEFLAQEAMEGVRNFRDNTDWNVDGLGTLNNGVIYHLEKVGAPQRWVLVGGEEVMQRFTRQIVFAEVLRDADKNIVAAGGVVDSGSRKITVTLSWTERGTARQITLVNFLTNWQ